MKKDGADNKLKAAIWGIKLAWKIDKKMLSMWMAVSFILAVLPAIALHFNREIISRLSAFLTTGTGAFSDVVPGIIILGVILTISGLSTRVNDDLLYMVMFDSFYLGLEQVMMEASNKIELQELLKKEKNDEYYAVISRCGSLSDITSSGVALLSKLVAVGSIMVVAFTASPIIFTATLLYVVVVIWLNATLSDKMRVVWSEMREHLRRTEYFEKLSQEGDTAKEARIFRSANIIKAHWNENHKKIEKMEQRNRAGYARLNFYTNLGFYIFMSGILSFSAWQVSTGAMEPSLLIMLFIMCTSIAANVSTIARSYQRMDYGFYGLDIQRRFIEGTPSFDETAEAKRLGTPTDENIVFSAKNLYFEYRKDTPILKNLNFEIKKGETVALVGANGSGKTTLVKVMLGLCRPTSGDALFMGSAHKEYKMEFVSSKVGSFFQDFYLFHLTLRENVGMGNVPNIGNDSMVIAAMEKGGAKKILDRLSGGLDTLLNRHVYKSGIMLSGGEGQRVAVSRAHMSDKDVMVFDEPASMLDPIAEMEQFNNIKKRLEGRTAVLVSHRIGFARLADRIIVLKDGEIVENGSHSELMKIDGEYARFFNEQAQWYDTSKVETEVNA